LIQIKASAQLGWQRELRQILSEDMPPMTTMTMPTTIERVAPRQPRGTSHLMPLLLAMVFLVATGVVSILISGPMH
jgi:hypothetical protein